MAAYTGRPFAPRLRALFSERCAVPPPRPFGIPRANAGRVHEKKLATSDISTHTRTGAL